MNQADLVIDSWGMRLLVRGIEIPTTTLEFRLLEYLARHRGQAFTRDFLLDAVWGEMRFVNPRSVDACIRRLREKIEPVREKPTILKTVRGIGYRVDVSAAWQSAPKEICDCPACTIRVSALGLRAPGASRRRPVSKASSAD
jgi:DNA-binding response OmpR family regulator